MEKAMLCILSISGNNAPIKRNNHFDITVGQKTEFINREYKLEYAMKPKIDAHTI